MLVQMTAVTTQNSQTVRLEGLMGTGPSDFGLVSLGVFPEGPTHPPPQKKKC